MGLATVESQYLDGRASLTCSDVTAADIDTEVMKMLHDSYKQAKKLLKSNREIMDKLADYLIEKETITGKEFMKIYRKEKGIPEPKEEEKEKKQEKSAADTDKEKKEGTQPKAVSDVPQNAAPVQQNTPPAPQNMPFVRQPAENPNVGLFSHSSLTPDFAQNLAKETESRPETVPGGEVPSDVSPEKQLSSDVPPAEQP